MKRDLKRNLLLLFAVFSGLILSAGKVFAENNVVTGSQGFSTDFVRSVFEKDVMKEYNSKIALNVNDPDTESADKNRVKLKIRRDKVKTKNQTEIPDINKNLITPNESPGINTDIQKSKRYYESLEDAHRTKIKKDSSNQNVIEEETLKLPARVQKDGTAVHIDKIEFSPKSEIFTESEIIKFKSLAEGQNLTAEDLDNLIRIINNQYQKKVLLQQKHI